jgi:hypothetical protein
VIAHFEVGSRTTIGVERSRVAVDQDVIVAPRADHSNRRTRPEHPHAASEYQSARDSEVSRAAVHDPDPLAVQAHFRQVITGLESQGKPARGEPIHGNPPFAIGSERRPVTSRGFGEQARVGVVEPRLPEQFGDNQQYLVSGPTPTPLGEYAGLVPSDCQEVIVVGWLVRRSRTFAAGPQIASPQHLAEIREHRSARTVPPSVKSAAQTPPVKLQKYGRSGTAPSFPIGPRTQLDCGLGPCLGENSLILGLDLLPSAVETVRVVKDPAAVIGEVGTGQ